MTTADALATQSEELVSRIAPLLHGADPAVQSAVLADLLALWLAGHFAETKEETAAVREERLTAHLALVRALVPVNEAAVLQRVREQSS